MAALPLGSGTLDEGMSNMDVLRAAFPAGTLTSAPKARAALRAAEQVQFGLDEPI